MRISACVITKNEEKNLPKWLECMNLIADELVVVDTGSTDGTVEIARAAGANCFFFQWVDDYSAAKNFAIDQATGDWIFFLDADEYFLSRDCAKAREHIRICNENPGVWGCVFSMVNIDKNTGQELGIAFHVIRAFRHTESLRYVGRIHEELRNLSEGPKKTMQYMPGIVIYHTGYSPELMPDKYRRTIRMLEKSQAMDGVRKVDDLYFMDCYHGLGDYEKAVMYARRAIANGAALLGSENRAYTVLVHSLILLKRPAWETKAVLREAMRLFPGLAEYWLFWGWLDWQQKDYASAEEHFRKGIQLHHEQESAQPKVLLDDHAKALLPFAHRCLEKISGQKARMDNFSKNKNNMEIT